MSEVFRKFLNANVSSIRAIATRLMEQALLMREEHLREFPTREEFFRRAAVYAGELAARTASTEEGQQLFSDYTSIFEDMALREGLIRAAYYVRLVIVEETVRHNALLNDRKLEEILRQYAEILRIQYARSKSA